MFNIFFANDWIRTADLWNWTTTTAQTVTFRQLNNHVNYIERQKLRIQILP